MLEKLKERVKLAIENNTVKALELNEPSCLQEELDSAYYHGREVAYQSVLDMIKEIEEKS